MGDWLTKPLGEILKLTKGISYKSSDYGTEDDGIIFINLKCIAKSGGFSERGIKFYKGYVPENLKLKQGDVIIANTDLTRNGDIVGCPLILPNLQTSEVTMSMDLSRLDLISDEIDEKFVYYALMTSSARKFMKENSSGSTVLHLKTSKVPSFRLLIPLEKTEQSTIATILTTTDQAIEKTEQLIAKYERIKAGLIQDLLTRGIDEQGNIRSEETHEFKDSELGRVPKEWRVGTVGKDCRIHNSFRKPLSAEVRENMQGKYPYYGPTGILDYINEFSVDGKYVLIGEDGDHFLKFIIQEMTLLINGKFNVNNHAHILEGKDDCITEWIHCFFCHRDITYHLTRQGAGRFKLNKAALSNLQIAIPKKDEQIRIIEKVDGIRTFLQCESQALDNYRKLKIGLMQDLLTGKIRVDYLLKKK